MHLTCLSSSHVTDLLAPQFIQYVRFKQLYRHIRIFDPFNEPRDSLNRLESRVKIRSDHIQQTSTDLFKSALAIAVDECMVRYTGRSRAKEIIPRKPIPQGLKVEEGNAATCTARLSSGIWVEFVKSKELDTVGKLDFVEVCWM
ncbi:hypothetical protein E4U23_003203 [Claviceps purpurea]|nr:hypothetical protein E4U23_003203 [Claviceps purpurea]